MKVRAPGRVLRAPLARAGGPAVFLCSTGADSCRPIKLRRNSRGYWKVLEFSSITLGCRKPKAQTAAGMDDDL